MRIRDQSGYGLSQWEETLQCNALSNWLNPYSECPLPLFQALLHSWISRNVSLCARSLFIFDEVDKFPPGLIDSVTGYLDHYRDIDGVVYRKAIFILIRWEGQYCNTGIWLRVGMHSSMGKLFIVGHSDRWNYESLSHIHLQGSFCLAPNQWETALQCNAVSYWLGAYTKRSLHVGCEAICFNFSALSSSMHTSTSRTVQRRGVGGCVWGWGGGEVGVGVVQCLPVCRHHTAVTWTMWRGNCFVFTVMATRVPFINIDWHYSPYRMDK